MNFRSATTSRRRESVIDITSLVDVVFLLIIFLLVTTTFKRREHAFVLDLPTATHTDLVVRTDRNTVYVTQEGELFYLELPDEGAGDTRPGTTPPTLSGDPLTADQLEKRLRDLAKRHPDVELSVRAQKDAPYRHVVGVMELCRKAGVKHVILPAEYVGPGAPPELPASGAPAVHPAAKADDDGPRGGGPGGNPTLDKR